jgi:hypothetical protein
VPQRAQLVLRDATTGTNTENLNKNASLTFEELDRNFLGVRDQTFGIVGDDSTGVDVAAGQTITATGTGGITVSVANDTITIDGSGIPDSDNQTLSFDGTNLTITGGNSVDISSLGGGDEIGNLEVTGANLQTLSGTVTNADVIIEPNGTGNIVANGLDIDRFNSTHNSNSYDTIQLAPNTDGSQKAQLWLKVDGSLSNNDNSIRYQSYSGKHVFYHSAGSEVKLTTDIGDAMKLCVDENSQGGSITIPTGTNGDIIIAPDGTGKIQLDNHYWPNTDGTTGQVLSTNGSGVLSFVDQSGGGDIGNLTVTGANSQTLTGTVTNASIVIDPNGTGSILLDSSNVRVGEDNTDVIITSRGRGDLKLRPEDSDATNPYILLECGVNGSTNVTGEIILKTTSAYVGIPAVKLDGAGGTIFNDVLRINENVFDLLDTNRDYTFNNNGTGSFVIDSALSLRENNISAIRSNDDLKLNPSGTGKIVIDGLYWPSVDGTAGQVLSTNGSGVLEWVDNAGGGGGLNNLVEDATPQLGGDLDFNSNDITGTGSITHTGNITTTGNISATGSIANDAVLINDNKITTSRSDDDLYVTAAGTGYLHLGKEYDATPVAAFANLVYNTGTLSYGSANINASSSTSRSYGHQRLLDATVTNSGTNGLARSRIIDEVAVDVNGLSWNQTSRGGGAHIVHFVTVKNTADGSTGAINWPQGNNSGILLADSGTASGSTVNISNIASYRSITQNFEQANDTFNVTNKHDFYAIRTLDTGAGTVNITNEYHYYSDFTSTPGISATNNYAFYCNQDSAANRLGGINLQNDQIQAFTTNDDLKIAENGTGKVNMVVSTQGSAGSVAGYMKMKVNGTEYAVPYYNLT